VGWRWGKNVDMSQYFHAVYHASITHTFATPLTHNFPMSYYRFVTYSTWSESSKAWQQWGRSIEKMWKTTPNVVVSWHVSSTQCRWAAYSRTWFGCGCTKTWASSYHIEHKQQVNTQKCKWTHTTTVWVCGEKN